MDIGTGIALLGVWGFATASLFAGIHTVGIIFCVFMAVFATHLLTD